MKIIVLAGGLSPERDVSLTSGSAICRVLRERGHKAFLLDVFFGLPYNSEKLEEVFDLPDAGLSIADSIKTTTPNLRALRASRPDQSDCELGPNVIELCRMADITFMALHGSIGENGKLQATFDVLGIKYTGPNSLGCSLSMNKLVAKQIFKMTKVPTPRGTSLTVKTKDTPLDELGYYLPLVVKPCSNGSSIGVYIVHTEGEYKEAVRRSFEADGEDEVVIEPYIKGREYACSIIAGKALPIVEIIPKDGIFNYENKYQFGGAQELCPPRSLDIKTQKRMQRAAEKAFEALRMDVYARADFILDETDGKFYCLEMNGLPGMTPASLIPKAAKAAGIDYGNLCELIIEESIKARYNQGGKHMKNLTLENITKICHGTYHGDEILFKEEVAGVVIDSRKVEKDYLFVAIDGVNVNAHKFIPDTIKRGAMCVVSHEDLGETDFPYILVESTGQALLDIAKLYRDSFDMKVVGITGSVGKTSTKEMIASVVAQKYKVHKTLGNFNNEWGLPITLFAMEPDTEVAILELGVNHFGEMRRLSSVANPDICVITNIGIAHLEFFKTREGILQEKTEMIQDMKDGGSIILNGDDNLLREVGPIKGTTPVLFGIGDNCEFCASNLKPLGLKGTSCTIHLPSGESFDCVIPLPGSHMVSNALAGAAVGYQLGLTPEEIKAGIEGLPSMPGRNNIISTEKFVILDDCYNANPVSMKAAIDVLDMAIGRKVAILGGMGELGDDAGQMHFDTGLHAANRNIDLVIGIGELAKDLVHGASEGTHTKALWFETKEEFFEKMPELLQKGDNVLVKASHAMWFPEIVEKLKEF